MKRMIFGFFTIIFIYLVQLVPGHAQEAATPVQLFMPDGQLKSHPVRVFVTNDVTEAMEPQFQLTGSHAICEQKAGESRLRKPEVVARHHKWVEIMEGERVGFTGTLLLYDLGKYPIPFYKAMMRVTPALRWKEKPGTDEPTHVAVGRREVYLGNSVGAFLWSLFVVAVLVSMIGLMAKRIKGKAINLFRSSDGRLSLWRSQLAAWTVAIGAVTLGYGLIRLEVPRIPDSLVALMGLSLATGGISYVRVSGRPSAGASTSPVPGEETPLRLADLVSNYPPDKKDGELSIAKAQMVFWTGLMLILFITKSILDGALWEVPWQTVTLMGMSQAGYLGPKFVTGRRPDSG